MTADRS